MEETEPEKMLAGETRVVFREDTAWVALVENATAALSATTDATVDQIQMCLRGDATMVSDFSLL